MKEKGFQRIKTNKNHIAIQKKEELKAKKNNVSLQLRKSSPVTKFSLIEDEVADKISEYNV